MRYAAQGCLVLSFVVDSLAGVVRSTDESLIGSSFNGVVATIGKRHSINHAAAFNTTLGSHPTDSSNTLVSVSEPCGQGAENCREAPKAAELGPSKSTYVKYRCELAVFHQSQVEMAAKKGCEINKSSWKFLLSSLQLSPSKFHLVQNNATVSGESKKLDGPFFIFPLMTSAETYTWGPKGEFRVLFNDKCQVAGVIHKKTSNKCEKNMCSIFKKVHTYEPCSIE